MTNAALDPFNDPKIQQMGSLLSRMTGDKPDDLKLSKTQVTSWIEVAIPRMVTQMPGLPPGMQCDIDKTSDDSWTLRISRPKA